MLIETKINIPPIVGKLVYREYLIDKLVMAHKKRLIVVNGVAGSGKTSLICDWINGQKLNVAWYSLGQADNDLDLFFRYILKSLCNTNRHLKSVFLPLLHHEKELTVSEVLPLIINHLSKISEEIFLVLDDYHFITNPEIHNALSYLLNYLTQCLHVVLISRLKIPNTLSRVKVKNQMAILTATDLQFTDKEAEQFLNNLVPGSLTTQETRELIQMTEGWVGGLQLFCLSEIGKLKESDFRKSLVEMNIDAADYLIKEVVNMLPDDIRGFIKSTALLERFNEEIACEITGIGEIPRIIDYIIQNHLFLVPLDNAGIWYRYHHLFADAIRENVKTLFPEMKAQTHRKAALWFANHGHPEDAFRNAFESQDLEFTADLMEDRLLDMPERHGYSSGLRWLSKLPPELLNQRPLLRLHECGQNIESFRLSEIKAMIHYYDNNEAELYDRYTGEKRKLCRVLYINFRAKLKYYYQNPSNANVEQLNKACQSILNDNKLFTGYIKSFIVHHYLLKGNINLIFNVLEEMSRLIYQSGSIWAQVQWYRLTATAERLSGRLNKSENVIQSALTYLSKKKLTDSPLASQFNIPMAWIHYHHNSLDKALECATNAVVSGERSQYVRDIIEGYLILTLVFIGKQDGEKARYYLKKLQNQVAKIDVPDTSISSEAWMIRLKYLLGDFQVCQHHLKNYRISSDQEMSFDLFLKGLTKAGLLFHQDRYEDALRLLEILRRGCAKNGMEEAVLEIDLLYCITLFHSDDSDSAKKILVDVLIQAEKEEYLKLLIDYAEPLMPILHATSQAETKKISDIFLKKVFQSCQAPDSNSSTHRKQTITSYKKLTRRETEVLELIATGYKYKEIAQLSFISVETVKSHVNSIYRKLDVSSRMQAAKKAESLQLLSSHTELAGNHFF